MHGIAVAIWSTVRSPTARSSSHRRSRWMPRKPHCKATPAYVHWQKEINDSEVVDQRKTLFRLAAAWPDDARRGQFRRFDHPAWHYVNFALTPGQPLTDVLQTEPFHGQPRDTLRSNLTIYEDPKASISDCAVALSWVLHLSGDITQPLHVTALAAGCSRAPTVRRELKHGAIPHLRGF